MFSMTSHCRPLLLMPCLVAASMAVSAPSAGMSLAQRVDTVVEEWVSQERIVGGVVLVARDGDVLYRRAAGYADRELHIEVSVDTIFRLASMSKTIVSATALALVERGHL